MVKFLDDRCTVHDLSDGNVIVAFGSLCHGLYRLDSYDRCVNDAAYSVLDTLAMSNAKLWHARFGHLNFNSLLHLHKNDIVLLLPNLKAHEKHVCEGCIVGKM